MSTDTRWIAGPERPRLTGGGCHVWRVPLTGSDASVTPWRALLNAEERAQADRFHFPHHRRRYTIAHGALRAILSRYLSVSPEVLGFERNPYGKPFLVNRPLEFNLSHSHELALIGIVEKGAIGIDLEWLRLNSDYKSIAKRFFSEVEYKAIEALPETVHLEAFFHCWTRKEAWIKARGMGLSIPLDEFHVSVDPSDEYVSLFEVGKSDRSDCWTIVRLDPSDGYVGAVAVEGNKLQLQCYDLIMP